MATVSPFCHCSLALKPASHGQIEQRAKINLDSGSGLCPRILSNSDLYSIKHKTHICLQVLSIIEEKTKDEHIFQYEIYTLVENLFILIIRYRLVSRGYMTIV
jgi:hypothetical protein